jgi:hypothetical protein
MNKEGYKLKPSHQARSESRNPARRILGTIEGALIWTWISIEFL